MPEKVLTEAELQAALKAHGDEIKTKQEELKTASEAKAAELKIEIEKFEGLRVKMQEQLDAISLEQTKAKKEGGAKDENLPLVDAIKQMLLSPEFKAAKAAKFKEKSVFQVKASTGDITGTVNMTVQRLQVGFAPDRALAFLPRLNVGYIGQDKNRLLWVEGTYTSNVGYVNEGTGQATADTGAAVEKSRGMAKISAKLPLSAEMLEDAEYIASAFKLKMQSRAMIFTDGEFYSGNGSDSPNPTHIYGMVSQSTPFDATIAGVSGQVAKANIGDLIDAAVLQAETYEQRGLDTIWMKPRDFFRFKKAKDDVGQYLFVKDVNGNYTINGLNVVRSSKVTANTMLLADSTKIQAWWKRNPEIKFSQMNGTDFVDDMYTAVMFLRAQCLVEDSDKTALIYVSDIDAAVQAITLV